MIQDRSVIEKCVPHTGAMVLLDTISRWDATSIECTARPHSAAHPLMRDGQVPAIAAVEYAAQAASVHGALLERPAAPGAGVLAKITDCSLLAGSIPSGNDGLSVEAELLSRSDGGCLYAFSVACGQSIARGRLMVAF